MKTFSYLLFFSITKRDLSIFFVCYEIRHFIFLILDLDKEDKKEEAKLSIQASMQHIYQQ